MRRPKKKPETTIILVASWRCNLKCSYCDFKVINDDGQSYDLQVFHERKHYDQELPWPAWLVYLNRFRPYHLELTGGEPALFKGMHDFMAHVPCDSSWAMTSNTLLDNVKLFEPDNCLHWTASYHHTQHDKFLENMRWLRNKGFPTRITFVLTPRNAEKCFAAIETFRKEEFLINIHPMLKEGFSWYRTPERVALLEKARALHDGIWVNFVDDVMKEWKPQQYSQCNAGGHYFSLMPDGQVLRCYSSMLDKKSEGHVGEYQPVSLYRPCKRECVFPCDLQHVREQEEAAA